ncbi:hypothetical protein [Oerskovia paurometabola]|uniref:Uncharacterized protein n=1 Tax=Oerskovia paurometabola TaxID=162170 RepID=A0ABW1X9A6_9CELL|nr:hypothetical protein [Oerskovia paurometabola]MBM7495723.1 septal ring factor EnvC (AmiA/AmiB activator) [Oerskovia paurometabola]
MPQARKLSKFNLVMGSCFMLALIGSVWSIAEYFRYRQSSNVYISQLEQENGDLRANVGATTSELVQVRQDLENAGAALEAANAEVVRLQGQITADPECLATGVDSRWCTRVIP